MKYDLFVSVDKIGCSKIYRKVNIQPTNSQSTCDNALFPLLNLMKNHLVTQ